MILIYLILVSPIVAKSKALPPLTSGEKGSAFPSVGLVPAQPFKFSKLYGNSIKLMPSSLTETNAGYANTLLLIGFIKAFSKTIKSSPGPS